MVKSHNFLNFKGQNKDFWIAILGNGKYDHSESEYCGHESLVSIHRALGPKDLKKGLNFKVIFSLFPNE